MRKFTAGAAGDDSRERDNHGKKWRRAVLRGVGGCSLLALFALCLAPPAGQAVAPPTEPSRLWRVAGEGLLDYDEAIVRVVRDLGHENRAKRTEAYNKLLKIGPRAIYQIRHGAKNDNPEWRRLAYKFFSAIQDKHGILATRHNGLEFLPFADLVWRIPLRGKEQPIKFGVKITNVAEKPVIFYLLDTVIPHLQGPDGLPVKVYGGRDGLALNNYDSPPLTKGKSYTVAHFRAKLCLSEDGRELRLKGKDPSSLAFSFPVKRGRYYLWFACGQGSLFRNMKKGGIQIWSGSIGTPFVVVDIR
jgi:hypothetical protein